MFFRTTAVGRLTRDPESQFTPAGIALCKFSIAVDRDVKVNGEKVTDFVNVVTWRKTAEFVTQYITKGRLVLVDGRMQSRKYTTQDGREMLVWELVGDHVQTLDKKPDDAGHAGEAPAPAAQSFDDGEDPFASE